MDERYEIKNVSNTQKALYIEPAESNDNIRLIAQNITLKQDE